MEMNLPNDPMLLLSVVNLKLRDFYKSLDEMCDDLGIDRSTLTQKLSGIDYEYDPGTNQFV